MNENKPGKQKHLPDFGECGLPSALEVMGERWSFMILRAAFSGLSHFEQFQTELGIARNILSNRLQRLVGHGILERTVLPHDRRKIAYLLTDKGVGLLPTMVALRQWGDEWVSCVPSTPILADRKDCLPVRPMEIVAQDGRTLGWHDLCWLTPDEVGVAPTRTAHVAPMRKAKTGG